MSLLQGEVLASGLNGNEPPRPLATLPVYNKQLEHLDNQVRHSGDGPTMRMRCTMHESRVTTAAHCGTTADPRRRCRCLGVWLQDGFTCERELSAFKAHLRSLRIAHRANNWNWALPLVDAPEEAREEFFASLVRYNSKRVTEAGACARLCLCELV